MSRKKKYPQAIVDSAYYCKALDGLEKSNYIKQDIVNYPYIFDKNPERNIFSIKRGTDFCVCSIEKDRIVFMFQGSGSIFSKDIKDWFNNFRAGKVDYEDFENDEIHKVGIHKGLYKTWKKFEKEILEICAEYGDSREIKVIGHSRGGGEAILCASFIGIKLGMTVDLITMGSLMVGDKAFRKLFRSLPINCTEVVIRRDPVTKLPGKRVLKYKHVGHIYKLKNKWWYFLPVPGIGFRCHTDYYDNIIENS